jgi:hypothetical protein
LIIIDSSHIGFQQNWDLICEKTQINPVFSAPFFQFYVEYSADKFESDHRLLVLENNKPTLALAMIKTHIDRPEYNYFENPLTLFSHLDFSQKGLQDAISLLLQECCKFMPIKSFTDSTKGYRYSESFNDKMISSFGKKFIKLSDVVVPVFEQFICLEHEFSLILRGFSKSVKSAIKDAIRVGLKVSVYDSNSGYSETANAFEELRRLHFESARRITRSDSTWELQFNLILGGNSFLITISDDSGVIGAALFYKNNVTAYYAVSAKVSETRLSVSHVLIYEGIKYSKSVGLKRLYMGKQFSKKISTTDNKIEAIENFKSFFGGEYVYGFLAKR